MLTFDRIFGSQEESLFLVLFLPVRVQGLKMWLNHKPMLMKIQMYVGITETTESKYSGSQFYVFIGVTYVGKPFSLLLMLPRQPPVVYLHPTRSHPACEEPNEEHKIHEIYICFSLGNAETSMKFYGT